MTNQQTPYGSLTYRQIGTWSDGTPRYEAVTSLSPSQQGLFDLGQQTQQNLGRIGVEQSGRVGDLLNEPFDLSNAATEARLMELGRTRLDPLLDRRRESTEQSVLNRGVRPGTEAYRRAMEGVSQGENDAYNQLLLTGRGQAINEALTQRNQPLNEITALLSGSQVSQPMFGATPQTGIQAPNYMGAASDAYAGDLANWQSQVGQQNALMGGLFGLGGSALGGWAGNWGA